MGKLHWRTFHFIAVNIAWGKSVLYFLKYRMPGAILNFLHIAYTIIATVFTTLQSETYSQENDEFFHVDNFTFAKL